MWFVSVSTTRNNASYWPGWMKKQLTLLLESQQTVTPDLSLMHGLAVKYDVVEKRYETAAFSSDEDEMKDLLLDNSRACQIPYLSQNGCMMPSVLTKVACQSISEILLPARCQAW